MQKLVSVLVPAYNAEKTIERCMNSIIAQTYDELEIIIIDDCSSDSTNEILQKYMYLNGGGKATICF